MKILVMTIVSVACFAGYVIVFGMAFGFSPSQMTGVFGAQKPGATTTDGAAADSSSLHDSTVVAIADSATTVEQGTESSGNDSLKLQMANISREKAGLEKLKSEITTLLKVKAKADSAQIGSLAKMYDGVEPAQLAQVMANMEDSLVIAILPRLKSQKAGKILERMPADRAARISSKLLGYN